MENILTKCVNVRSISEECCIYDTLLMAVTSDTVASSTIRDYMDSYSLVALSMVSRSLCLSYDWIPVHRAMDKNMAIALLSIGDPFRGLSNDEIEETDIHICGSIVYGGLIGRDFFKESCLVNDLSNKDPYVVNVLCNEKSVGSVVDALVRNYSARGDLVTDTGKSVILELARMHAVMPINTRSHCSAVRVRVSGRDIAFVVTPIPDEDDGYMKGPLVSMNNYYFIPAADRDWIVSIEDVTSVRDLRMVLNPSIVTAPSTVYLDTIGDVLNEFGSAIDRVTSAERVRSYYECRLGLLPGAASLETVLEYFVPLLARALARQLDMMRLRTLRSVIWEGDLSEGQRYLVREAVNVYLSFETSVPIDGTDVGQYEVRLPKLRMLYGGKSIDTGRLYVSGGDECIWLLERERRHIV